MQTLTITTPDDWHLHFRDNEMLAETVPATARCFQRAIVMPNLVPPVVNAEMAMAYKGRIEAARPQGSNFEPLMTLDREQLQIIYTSVRETGERPLLYG